MRLLLKSTLHNSAPLLVARHLSLSISAMPLFVPVTCFQTLLNKSARSHSGGAETVAPSQPKTNICLSQGSKVVPSLGTCLGAESAALQDGTEKLLLPERVFRGGHRRHQRVLFGVGFTIRQQVRRRFGHLYPVDVGLHLELFYQFPRLCDARRVVGRHWTGVTPPVVLSVSVSPPLSSCSLLSFKFPTPRSFLQRSSHIQWRGAARGAMRNGGERERERDGMGLAERVSES